MGARGLYPGSALKGHTPGGARGPFEMLGLEPGLATCNINAPAPFLRVNIITCVLCYILLINTGPNFQR